MHQTGANHMAKNGSEPVQSAIAQYPRTDDGLKVMVDAVELEIAEVERWHEEYQRLDAVFRKWCAINARTAADNLIGAVFGSTSSLLDGARQEIRWPEWFADCLITYLARKHGYAEATPRLVEQLVSQLDFECEFNLDAMGNARLYPPHMEIIAALSGCASGEPTLQALENMPKVYERLTSYWMADKDTERLLQGLRENAAKSMMLCEYDPRLIFRAFRADVAQWAMDVYPDDLLRSEETAAGLEQGIDRFAMARFIDYEKEITKAIAERKKTSSSSAPAFTRNRIPSLMAGTSYLP